MTMKQLPHYYPCRRPKRREQVGSRPHPCLHPGASSGLYGLDYGFGLEITPQHPRPHRSHDP